MSITILSSFQASIFSGSVSEVIDFFFFCLSGCRFTSEIKQICSLDWFPWLFQAGHPRKTHKCIFGSKWNWNGLSDSRSLIWLIQFCEKCMCAHSPCKRTLSKHMQTATLHLSLSCCFYSIPHHLLFLYSSSTAGNNCTFQFLNRAVCLLCVCWQITKYLANEKFCGYLHVTSEETTTGGEHWRMVFHLQDTSSLSYPIYNNCYKW